MAFFTWAPRLSTLRSVVAVHRVEAFPVPRPKALLGHEHLTRMVATLHGVMARQPRGAFRTFRVSAAGADSPVFERLKEEIARQTGLSPGEHEADLALAVRPTPEGEGWQVLVRRTRGLSARAWRVYSMPGALDATVAHVGDDPGGPQAGRFLGHEGQGLLVKRLALGPAPRRWGGYLACLACARENCAGGLDAVRLLRAGRAAPLADASWDTVVAGPLGALVGAAENGNSYPPSPPRPPGGGAGTTGPDHRPTGCSADPGPDGGR